MRARALCVVVVLVAAAPAAWAEVASRDAARDAYARGQQLFQSGDFEGALRAFEEAYDAAPHPVVLKSQAECQERLGHYRQAVELLERYLADRPDAPDRADIETRIASHRARPGTLRIISSPPGAQVTLDGRRLTEATPITTEVPSGAHAAAIELEGYQMVLQEFDVSFGEERTVEVTLAPIGAPPETPPVGVGGEEGGGEAGGGEEGGGEAGGGEEGGGATPPEAGPGVRMSTPVWVMTGLAGAGLLTGIISGSLALADQGEFDDGVERGEARDRLEELADAGQTKALVADIAFGVAAAAAITGIVLFFVENARAQPEYESSGLTISPSIAGDGGGVSATLRF